MVTSEIFLITNQVDKVGIQNVLHQMPGIVEYHLHNQGVGVIFDSQKTQYDCIIEGIMQAGYQVAWFYVTEDDEGSTH